MRCYSTAPGHLAQVPRRPDVLGAMPSQDGIPCGAMRGRREGCEWSRGGSYRLTASPGWLGMRWIVRALLVPSTLDCVIICNCSECCVRATDRGWVNGSRGLCGGGFTVYPSPSTTTTFSTTLLPPTTSSQPSQKIFKKHFWTYPPGLKHFNSPGLMGGRGWTGLEQDLRPGGTAQGGGQQVSPCLT